MFFPSRIWQQTHHHKRTHHHHHHHHHHLYKTTDLTQASKLIMQFTLQWTNVAMENHHFLIGDTWSKGPCSSVPASYVSLPEYNCQGHTPNRMWKSPFSGNSWVVPFTTGVQKKAQLKPIFEGRGPQNKAEIPIKQGAPFGFQIIEKTSPNNAFWRANPSKLPCICIE